MAKLVDIKWRVNIIISSRFTRQFEENPTLMPVDVGSIPGEGPYKLKTFVLNYLPPLVVVFTCEGPYGASIHLDLSRVLEPVIYMQLFFSNGTSRSLEIPVSKFHTLRQNVAMLLKEVDTINRKGANILRIIGP